MQTLQHAASALRPRSSLPQECSLQVSLTYVHTLRNSSTDVSKSAFLIYFLIFCLRDARACTHTERQQRCTQSGSRPHRHSYIHMKNGTIENSENDNEPTQPSLWKDSDSRHSMAFSQVEKEQFHTYFVGC